MCCVAYVLCSLSAAKVWNEPTIAMASYLLAPVESVLQHMIDGHERYIYNPMHHHLKPVVQRIPRRVVVCNRQRDVFTANAVTYFRTSLVIAMALCLKSGWNVTACLLVIANDILDHVDGIVAKVHREQYGQIDDPMFGAFIDAFCDKVVNVFMLWTILTLVSWTSMSLLQAVMFVGVCGGVMALEVVLGIVRVQDYFKAKYGVVGGGKSSSGPANIRAVAVGKIKEKLENVGLALLSLSLMSSNPMDTWVGVMGIGSLCLSLRFAVGSLMHKLRARKMLDGENRTELANGSAVLHKTLNGTVTYNALTDNVFNELEGSDLQRLLPKVQSAPQFQISHSCSSDDSEEDERRRRSGDERVDKVYTVGCFDLFHHGHVKLLKNMRKLGKEVIVGVHSDESYFKLKNKHAIDNTEKRMSNVKKYADQVFVISSTDPSPYLRCCVHVEEGQTALYVRGDDMPLFPGRSVVEPLMPIKLLPYTQGVSSTMLRAQLLQGKNGTVQDDVIKLDNGTSQETDKKNQ